MAQLAPLASDDRTADCAGASPCLAPTAARARKTPCPQLPPLTALAWTLGRRGGQHCWQRAAVLLLLGLARPAASQCLNTCVGNPSYASDGYCDDGGPGSEYADCALSTDCVDCGTRVQPPLPPPLAPRPPQLPPQPQQPPPPPWSSSLCSDVDARFGCDCVSGCDHVASVATSAQLSTAVGDTSKTCIKLAAGVVFDAPSSSSGSTWLQIDHTVALVAEAGNATLDGLGTQRLMSLSAAADVSLCNLVLTNGSAAVSCVPSTPGRRAPRRLNERAPACRTGVAPSTATGATPR